MTTLFVLGGARSGKSRYAQRRVEAMPGKLGFIATAQAADVEMEERIARHRADRGPRWTAHEAPLDLAGAIGRMQLEADAILVDCLTLWLSNLMHFEHDVEAATASLEAAVRNCRVPVTLVANEVGQGIVPMNALARRFRDQAGWLNQRMAARCEQVVLVTAGLPLTLK